VFPQDDAVRTDEPYARGVSNHRALLPDGYFHVIARGIPERPIYVDDDDRRLFMALVPRTVDLHRLTIHALCLMSTHYHAVVEAAVIDLSNGMRRLHGQYATRFNRRHGRFGSLFAERFVSRVIASEDYLYEACAYVLLNPVKAGLCQRVEDWPWSYSRYGVENM